MCYTVAVLSIYIHEVTKVPYLSPEINKISLEESVRLISLMNSKVSKGKVTVHLFGTVFRVLIPCLRNASSSVTFLTPVISKTKEACCSWQQTRPEMRLLLCLLPKDGGHWDSHHLYVLNGSSTGVEVTNYILNPKHQVGTKHKDYGILG